jgi:hypothetical protein
MDSAWFLWSSVISLIGFAVITYGRRQRRAAPTLIGLVLMVYPYFVSSTFALLGIGLLLIGGLIVGNRLENNL